MDKPCGRSAAGAMIGVATAMRLIWHFSIVDNAAYNSAWLCPLIGLIFFLPIGYAIKALSQETCGCAFNAPFLSEKAPLGRIIASVSFMLLSIDAAHNVLLLSHTANIMALGEVPIWLVSIAFALLAFICAFLGMQAEGRSAMIWLRIMIPLLAVMVIVQFGSYRPEWLTPIFGGGFKAIFSGGLRSAAYISLLSLPWLICAEDHSRRNVTACTFAGAVAASVILLLFAMLSPAMVKTSFSRSARIELILSNGRVHLLLQMITVVLWFASLLHLTAAECSSAAAFLGKTASKCSKLIASAITAIIVYIIAVTGLLSSDVFAEYFYALLYPFICLMLIVAAAFAYAAKKREPNAKCN